LYFDIRKFDEDAGTFAPSIIDAIRVNPSVTGPYMHVYFSNESANGAAPKRIEEWENILWTPVPQTYVLDKNHTYDLPRPIRASWVCLEFTNLQPMPYALPQIPRLPAVTYKQHPSWAQALIAEHGSFSGAPATLDGSSFAPTTQVVKFNPFDLYKTVSEFVINNRIVQDTEVQDNTPFAKKLQGNQIDPTTLAQIYFNTSRMFTKNLATETGNGGSFGQYVADRASRNGTNYPSEFVLSSTPPAVQNVSTNDPSRHTDAFTNIALEPVYFDRVARHDYQHIKATFNKKAFFCGVTDVQFFRKDYTIERDDDVIHDVLGERDLNASPLISLSTWIPEAPSTIPAGQSIYLSYQVNAVRVTNEVVQFESTDEALNYNPIPLQGVGGRATSIIVSSDRNGAGNTYTLGADFDIIYDPDSQTNSVVRNELHYRLVSTPTQATEDFNVVTGIANVSAVESASYVPEDAMVTSVASISALEVYRTAGASAYTDAATVTGRAVPIGVDLKDPRVYTDSGAVTGASSVGGNDIYSGAAGVEYNDSASIIGHAQPSAGEIYNQGNVDAATITGQANITALEHFGLQSGIDILDRPTLAVVNESLSNIISLTNQPILYPLAPEGQKYIRARAMRALITRGSSGSNASLAVYAYTYTGSGQFSADLVAITQPTSVTNTGVITAEFASEVVLDFTTTTYFVGVVTDAPGGNAWFGGTAADFGRSLMRFTSPLTSVSAWPSTFTQAAVSAYNIYPYIAVVTTDGEGYV
jgi:hypothetical protein